MRNASWGIGPMSRFSKTALLFVILFFSNDLTAQFETINVGDRAISQDSIGYVKLFFKKKPDSVRLGKFVVPAHQTKRYRVPIGWLHYQAYLDCYHSIQDSVIITRGSISQVRLLFDKVMTPELKLFHLNRWEMAGMVGLGGLSAISSSGRLYSLPLLGVGLVQQFMWRRSARDNLAICKGKVLKEPYQQGNWAFMVGLQSVARFGGRYNYEGLYNNQFVLPNITINLNYDIDLVAGSGGDAESDGDYGLQLMASRQVNPRIATRFGATVFPFFSLGAALNDSIIFFNRFDRNNQEKSENSPLVVLEANLDYTLLGGINKRLIFSLGAYASNTVSKELTFELDAPTSITSRDLQSTLPLDLSYRVFGVKAGINYRYYLSNSLGMYFNAEFGALSQLTIESPLESASTNSVGGQLSLSSGLFFH